jgi:small subunit ribosomal protein S17
MIGRVVSAKMQKTVAVLVEGKKTHPLYGKSYVWSKKYLVRDEIGAKLGDVVVIEETKPISKRVHWKLNKIVGADIVALGEAAMKQVEEEAIAEVMPEEKEEVEAVESEAVVDEKEVKETKKKAAKKTKASDSNKKEKK